MPKTETRPNQRLSARTTLPWDVVAGLVPPAATAARGNWRDNPGRAHVDATVGHRIDLSVRSGLGHRLSTFQVHADDSTGGLDVHTTVLTYTVRRTGNRIPLGMATYGSFMSLLAEAIASADPAAEVGIVSDDQFGSHAYRLLGEVPGGLAEWALVEPGR